MAALRSALWRMSKATRADLSASTGLSTMTVGKLLSVMEKRGEVIQKETVQGTAGRPSMIAQYNRNYAHFAVITAEQQRGRSAFALSVCNLAGEMVLREEMLLENVTVDCFDDFFVRAEMAGYDLALAVFVLPGVAQGDEIVFCDLQALCDGQVLKRIKECFGVDVLFENDVNSAVFGHAFDQDKGVCAGIYYPKNYCPGAGVVIDGEILYGKNHFAGEIGWIDEADDWKDITGISMQIVQMLVIYACTVAPEKMVLYGDFFTTELEQTIRERFDIRMQGRFSMEITFNEAMTPDMERGAKKLGLRRMFELLRKND